MTRSELIDLTLFKHTFTERAILVSETGEGPKVWLPLSQIECEPSDKDNVIAVTMPEWLAIEKRLV